MKDSLRKILTDAGVLDESVIDPAQAEVLNFAITMHNRIVEKQKEITGEYAGDMTITNWTEDQGAGDINVLLLAIGKNVSELAKEVKDGVVSSTASVDIANIALIVDTYLRKNYGS